MARAANKLGYLFFFSRPRDENKDIVSNAPGELSSLEPNWRRTRSVSASSPHSSLQVFPSHASPITPSRYNPVYISRPSSVMSNRSSKVPIFFYFNITHTIIIVSNQTIYYLLDFHFIKTFPVYESQPLTFFVKMHLSKAKCCENLLHRQWSSRPQCHITLPVTVFQGQDSSELIALLHHTNHEARVPCLKHHLGER